MAPHLSRMVQEHKELMDKLLKARRFMGASIIFRDLEDDDKRLLREQAEGMQVYADRLALRIQRAGGETA